MWFLIIACKTATFYKINDGEKRKNLINIKLNWKYTHTNYIVLSLFR